MKNKMCRGARGCCNGNYTLLANTSKFVHSASLSLGNKTDTTTTRQRGLKISSLAAQPGIGPFGLQRHPRPALMELPDHISQQGQFNQQSRTGQSWQPKVQRPTTKTKACCVVGCLDSREEPSLYINLFQTHKSASSICESIGFWA